MNRYRAFGLSIASKFSLPELLPEGDAGASVDLWVKEWVEGEEGAPSFTSGDEATGSLYHLSVSGVADFRIEDGTRIHFRRASETVDDAIVRLFLLGSGFGCALQQRGCIVLHGNAVTTDGETCRIVVGHSGAGKSTSAALAYKQGARILADDVCAITLDSNGTGWVHPAYPQIKLWKRSADLLGISVEGLRRIRPSDEKYALPIRDRYWPTPLPLAEVVELSAENTEETPSRGFDKARCLAEHSYRNWFLSNMGIKAEYMDKLMRLVSRVEVRRGVRADLSALGFTARQGAGEA